ncbi:hypothetical protein HYH03_007220 [Edaphochlamys debaryana]|uniref:Mediator complex subunit 20 n=1 Tax=Edaphochlamys debaryana TaxID=47281 RepID=A0A835Y5T7_9CHLO|nr:hypothetical protein HYH03_007220 [Edaphochlamys debaryana]|eukprot:KAG2494706.1 hypothetical protein HYH03_007220 [Edaphochlamys debaryana]
MGGPAAGPAAGAGGLCKDMWAVTFKEAPDQAYLLIRPDHKALECDAAVLRLLEKKLEYGKQMTVTLAGPTFSKGDFVLRLCTATQQIHSNQALLGHCLELEYLPVSSPAVAEGMVGEFVDLLRQTLTAAGGAGLELVRPSYDKYGMGGQPYGRLHAAVAYGEMVVTLLNASAAAQQPAAK